MNNFKNIKIFEYITHKKTLLYVSLTHINFKCTDCYFREKGSHCPQGKHKPICFASENKNKESVYFRVSTSKNKK